MCIFLFHLDKYTVQVKAFAKGVAKLSPILNAIVFPSFVKPLDTAPLPLCIEKWSQIKSLLRKTMRLSAELLNDATE